MPFVLSDQYCREGDHSVRHRHISRLTKHPTQMYSVSTSALWAYDYLLTVGDEVGIVNCNDIGRKLTILSGPLRMENREHSQYANLRIFAG